MKQPKQPKLDVNYIGTKVAAKYLLLTDSNLARIKPNLLNKEIKGMKVFCPTFKQTLRFLDQVEVETQPTNILFHCGTNDLENSDFSEIKFEDDFILVLKKMREVFSLARIVVSSLLPRIEMKFYCAIRNLNDFMAGCCSVSHKMIFMRNHNIKMNMLRDNKHIDMIGFRIIISNIRYFLFRRIPYG